MSFLAPAFLVGLLAIAVPVLIHLIQRERLRTVEFPSLMFLRKIPYQSVRRRRIRHWMLLAMRIAALALIVAAFARPFIRGRQAVAQSSSTAREVVVLLDRSYSMGYGTHWERARRAAADTVRGLGGADRVSLVLFGTGAEMAVRSTTDRAPVVAAIDSAQVGAGGTRFGPALKLAQSVLAESRLARREIVLVSDFQRSAWKREDAISLSPGTSFKPVSVAETPTSNVVLLTTTLTRGSFAGQERVTVAAALSNHGSAPAHPAVTLEIEGRTIQTEDVELAADGSGSVTFAPVSLPAQGTRGTVRVASDLLSQDNTAHFVAAPAQSIATLIVERPDAGRDASLYLRRALGVGRAPVFETKVVGVNQIREEDWLGRQVVIFNDVPVTTTLAARARRFVESGGGLLAVFGDRASWPDEGGNALVGRLGAPVDRVTGQLGSLASLDYSHPVFEVFGAPRSGDFSVARFFRYRGMTMPDGASVLARYDDGAVALGEATVGRGRAMIWTSTLDNTWNDLVVKPVFLPFAHLIVRHLARFEERPPFSVVGQVVDLSAIGSTAPVPAQVANARGRNFEMALTPSGRRIALSEGDHPGVIELTEEGFYELHSQAGGSDKSVSLAANVDTAESDLTAIDPQELAAALTGRGRSEVPAAAPPALPEDAERRQTVWWYLLLAGLVLLAIETIVSNRLSRHELTLGYEAPVSR
jgi:hypothetical protein